MFRTARLYIAMVTDMMSSVPAKPSPAGRRGETQRDGAASDTRPLVLKDHYNVFGGLLC